MFDIIQCFALQFVLYEIMIFEKALLGRKFGRDDSSVTKAPVEMAITPRAIIRADSNPACGNWPQAGFKSQGLVVCPKSFPCVFFLYTLRGRMSISAIILYNADNDEKLDNNDNNNLLFIIKDSYGHGKCYRGCFGPVWKVRIYNAHSNGYVHVEGNAVVATYTGNGTVYKISKGANFYLYDANAAKFICWSNRKKVRKPTLIARKHKKVIRTPAIFLCFSSANAFSSDEENISHSQCACVNFEIWFPQTNIIEAHMSIFYRIHKPVMLVDTSLLTYATSRFGIYSIYTSNDNF
ncbi:hypothetical protein NQ318_023383 [Aromia moschata]|uniref:Uncharacterized protein n=1 Tax=Aromia moschata TaxID=1265417 RepID=A0AAV8YV08_9CUCU|nr:hypothetical protein NQ318_023383 [Aromia moschata]